jgi:hypothetical protein
MELHFRLVAREYDVVRGAKNEGSSISIKNVEENGVF